MLCEFEDFKTMKIGYYCKDPGNSLLDYGCDVFMSEWYPIERYGIEHSWRCIKRYPCETESLDSWGDFIAINNEHTDAFILLTRKRYRVDLKEMPRYGP